MLTHATDTGPGAAYAGSIRVLRFPETVRSAGYPLSLSLPLFRFLAERADDFDVVHAHGYHSLAGQEAARSGLPFVFTPHYHGTGHTLAAALMHRVYRPAGAQVLARADAVICVSQTERDLLSRDFPAIARKIRVIRGGTDPRPAGKQAGSSGQPVLLTVGRLRRYENVDLIIRAFRGLPANAVLVVVGDGPERDRLARLACTARPPGRIRFAGRVSDGELDGLLAVADVVTSASDHDVFGLVVADGLSAGVRVVASDIPAHHEVGRLAGPEAPITYVEPRNTGHFTAALAAALAGGKATAIPAWLPSWSEVAAQTRELYATVAAMTGEKSLKVA